MSGKHRAPSRHSTGPISIVAITGAAALYGGATTAQAAPDWDRLAMCESSGNWGINTGNGFHGGLQFHPNTWTGFGGGVYAATADLATREQQIEIAEKVLAAQGPQAWPDCSNNKVPGWWNTGPDPAPAPPPAPAPAPPPAPVANTSGWMWPVDCPLTSGHGARSGGFHNGADFGCAVGTPIRAAATGRIVNAGEAQGYGLWIQQIADGGEVIDYGHISTWNVQIGQHVKVGDVIGATGNTGQSSGPHLHLRIARNGQGVDPVWFLNHVGAANTGDTQAVEPAPIFDEVAAEMNATPIFDEVASEYAVQWGDTLSAVAHRFGMTVPMIVELNPWIGDPDLIFADRDVLRVK